MEYGGMQKKMSPMGFKYDLFLHYQLSNQVKTYIENELIATGLENKNFNIDSKVKVHRIGDKVGNFVNLEDEYVELIAEKLIDTFGIKSTDIFLHEKSSNLFDMAKKFYEITNTTAVTNSGDLRYALPYSIEDYEYLNRIDNGNDKLSFKNLVKYKLNNSKFDFLINRATDEVTLIDLSEL